MTKQTGVGTFDFSSLGSPAPMKAKPAVPVQTPTGNLPNGGHYIGGAPEQSPLLPDDSTAGWPYVAESALEVAADPLLPVEPELPELPEAQPVVAVKAKANKVASAKVK